jgi:hypothetical protein
VLLSLLSTLGACGGSSSEPTAMVAPEVGAPEVGPCLEVEYIENEVLVHPPEACDRTLPPGYPADDAPGLYSPAALWFADTSGWSTVDALGAWAPSPAPPYPAGTTFVDLRYQAIPSGPTSGVQLSLCQWALYNATQLVIVSSPDTCTPTVF